MPLTATVVRIKCGVYLCELIRYVVKFSAELSAWVVGRSSVEQKSYIRPCAVARARELHPPLPPIILFFLVVWACEL